MSDPRPIILTVTASLPRWFEQMAAAYSGDQSALLERRILEGENRVELDYLPDVIADKPPAERRLVVYLVPSWWKHPLRRLEVTKARREWRRKQRATKDSVANGSLTVNEARAELAPDPLRELDLTEYGCMVPTTAAQWGRRVIRERRERMLPVDYPVEVTFRGVDGRADLILLP